MKRLLLTIVFMLPMMANANTNKKAEASIHDASQENHELCEFVPENDMHIAVNSFNANNEMTEEIFNEILDNLYEIYQPMFAAQGATFDLQKAWDNSQVNAFARRSGSTWIVKMFGGLARHPNMTPDGFAMVACHEVGHHLGGAPKKFGWASGEGQSDYFATLKCTRFIWERMNNLGFAVRSIQDGSIDPVAREKCSQAHRNVNDQALCMRSAMGALALGKVLQSLGREATTPTLSTPDPRKVSRTSNGHPRAQCRVDTYFAGAICGADRDTNVSDSDPDVGTCSRRFGATDGVRPTCWYKPANSFNDGPVLANLPSAFSIQ